MIEVLVWLLISTSVSSYNRGSAVVLERFKSKEQCEHVKKNIPASEYLIAKCVQANIYIPSK